MKGASGQDIVTFDDLVEIYNIPFSQVYLLILEHHLNFKVGTDKLVPDQGATRHEFCGRISHGSSLGFILGMKAEGMSYEPKWQYPSWLAT